MTDKNKDQPQVNKAPSYSSDKSNGKRNQSPQIYLNLNVRGLPQSATPPRINQT